MMISLELSTILDAARFALAEDREWELLNSIPDGASRKPSFEAPREYLEFLDAADGIIVGSLVILDTKLAPRMQKLIEFGMTEVPLGCDDWFFVGKINENPVLVSRESGTVWGFPDMVTTWWESLEFRKYSETLDEFILQYCFSPKYQEAALVPDDDQWLRFLRRLGRVA